MATTSGTISTATGSVTLTYTNENSILVQISGTYAGFVIYFEYSPDNTNWFACLCGTPGVSANVVSNYTPLANETRFFTFYGAQTGLYFRVRNTALTSGSMSVTITSS